MTPIAIPQRRTQTLTWPIAVACALSSSVSRPTTCHGHNNPQMHWSLILVPVRVSLVSLCTRLTFRDPSPAYSQPSHHASGSSGAPPPDPPVDPLKDVNLACAAWRRTALALAVAARRRGLVGLVG